MAFCFALAGGCLLFGDWQTVDDTREIDTEFERVTLSQWLDGQTANKTLFEITDFEIGDHYWTSKGEYRNLFGMVYVPLFQPGEKDNTGAAIVAVVGLPDCSRADVRQVFAAKSLSLQDYQEDVPESAAALSQAYPKIDWSTTRWAIVDPALPAPPMGHKLRSIGVVSCLLSALAGFSGMVLWFWNWKPERREVAKPETKKEMAANDQATKNPFVNKASKPSFMSDTVPKVGRVGKMAAIVGLLLGLSVIVLNWVFGVLGNSIATPVLYIAAPLLLLGGAFSLGARFFAVPKLRIEPKLADQISQRACKRLESVSRKFQEYGFEFIGFAEADFLGAKKQFAFLQSSNREAAVEVTWQKGKLSYVIHGITDDGLIYQVGKRPADVEIDGISFGIPIAANLKAKTDVATVIKDFGTFHAKVNNNGSRILKVSSDSLFHLMHYETILTSWWAYKRSKRFSKPESMPTLSELSNDGAVFSFNRDDSYSHAFEKVAVAVDQISVDGGEVESSSDGNQVGRSAVHAAITPAAGASAVELASARFFGSTEAL